MKRFITTAIIAISAMFAGVNTTVQAEDCCAKPLICLKKKVKTEEICRRVFCKTKCVLGCIKVIQFEEVTYCTTYCDCCGCITTKEWTKVYRIGPVCPETACCGEDK